MIFAHVSYLSIYHRQLFCNFCIKTRFVSYLRIWVAQSVMRGNIKDTTVDIVTSIAWVVPAVRQRQKLDIQNFLTNCYQL